MYSNLFKRLFLFLFFGVYCFIYPSSLFLLATNSVPVGTEWMATLMLALVGLAATAWMVLNYGLGRGLAAGAAMLVGGFAVETVGVSTGFPFGAYTYTEALAPKLLVVPIGITSAWMMIVLSSFFMSRFVVARLWPHRGLASVVCLSAALTVLSDLVMEPVAVHIQGYWLWRDGGAYYGVPTSNFVAWTVVSLLLVLLLALIVGERRLDALKARSVEYQYRFVPIALYLMNLAMFTIVNLTHLNYLAGCIGLGVGLVCGLLLARASGLMQRRPLFA